MHETGIIVVDRSRARFITVTPGDPDLEGGPKLEEQRDLVNPAGELSERELYSDRTGLLHGAPSGAAHASDDHRARHTEETERRFAAAVIDEARRFAVEHGLSRIVLLAGPKLLGVLRGKLDRSGFRDVEMIELGEGFAGQPLQEIRDALCRRGVLPEARTPRGAVYRPRGQEPALR